MAAGLSGAVASSHIVVTARLAEIAAGSIAMGLGGYLAAKSDAEHYASERTREEQEVVAVPEVEDMKSSRSSRPLALQPRKARLWSRRCASVRRAGSIS